MSKKRWLIAGWFGNGNLGDENFKVAHQELWGSVADLTFVNSIPNDCNDYDACLIGGGSFLDQAFPGIGSLKIPVGFIGVGLHRDIHTENLSVLKRARVIVSRNGGTDFPAETVRASDLAFSRRYVDVKPCPGGVLVLGNDFLVPRKKDPYWKHSAWYWFVHDFSDVLDGFVDRDIGIEFYPMCCSGGEAVGIHDDRVFAMHVAAQMRKRAKVKMHLGMPTENELFSKIRGASLVVSMRFHGDVFATIFGVPFIGICFHDKMISYFRGFGIENHMDYYGFTKKKFDRVLRNRLPRSEYLLSVTKRERVRWGEIKDLVLRKLGA